MHLMRKKASDTFRYAKDNLMNAAKKDARNRFFLETIDVIDINKQLEDPSQLDLDADEWKPQKMVCRLEECSTGCGSHLYGNNSSRQAVQFRSPDSHYERLLTCITRRSLHGDRDTRHQRSGRDFEACPIS